MSKICQRLLDNRFCRRYGPFWTNKLNDRVSPRLLQPAFFLCGDGSVSTNLHSVVPSILEESLEGDDTVTTYLSSGPSPDVSFHTGILGYPLINLSQSNWSEPLHRPKRLFASATPCSTRETY